MRFNYGVFCSAIFAGFFLFSARASAQNASIVECVECTAPQMIQLAEGAALSKWTRGSSVSADVFIIDPSSATVHRYGVDVQDDFRDPIYWDRDGAIVSSWEVAVPQEVLEYRYLARNGLTVALPGDPQLPVSAYEDIENPIYATRISDYLNQQTDGMRVVRLTQFVLGIFGLDTDKLGKVIFTIKYANGHVRLYEWDRDRRTFIPIPDSAKDNDNNRIPEELMDVAPPAGQINYDFAGSNNYDLQEFFNRLNSLNVPIYNTLGTQIFQPASGGANIVCRGSEVDGRVQVRCEYSEVRIDG